MARGKGEGTGTPLTLKCRARIDGGLSGAITRTCLSTRLRATGVVLPLTKAQEGRGGQRRLDVRVVVQCRDCKHEMASRHVDAARLYRAAGYGDEPKR